MVGYKGKILRINLTTGEIIKENLDIERAKKYIGGRGLASIMLLEELPQDVDPLSPDNKLFIATGPLTGASVPASGRYMVVTKSPLNNAITSSNSGGYWGAELKFAGYDMLIIEGKAKQPIFIYIHDGKIELISAKNIWGKIVSETRDLLIEHLAEPKARVLCIGPAGENLSLISAIMNDHFRAAARNGVGAVMGSKNLKAIVVKGSSRVQIADPEELKKVQKAVTKKITENAVTGKGLPTYGTAFLVNVVNESGVYPTKNFQKSYFTNAEATSGEALAEKYFKKKETCFRCPIACGRICEVDVEKGSGPEYETLWAFGADCGVDDLPSIIKANNLCNEMGLDTISAGNTIAAAMELYEKGYIKDTELAGGPRLNFGNPQAIVHYTREMGLSRGIGAKLAKGSYRLAESYGVPEIAMAVKKLELPAYDPRGVQGQGLEYATANRGGCHIKGYVVISELLGIPERIDKMSVEGKASLVKNYQDLTAVIDSTGLCLFTYFALNIDDYAALLSAVLGEKYTSQDLLLMGERIWNVERLFNMANGYTKLDDTLPKRLLQEPISNGPLKGNKSQLTKLLPEYYEVRGWSQDGVPTEEKLRELELL